MPPSPQPSPPAPPASRALLTQTLILAFLSVAILFFWQGNKGFSLTDEGFLWYGAQRVMQGEIPLRDFRSYDPGRYYWSAALMSLQGSDGIIALRGAVAVFQALGLFVGLWLVGRSLKKPSLPYLLLAALILAAWMLPRHKLFDISISIMAIAALAYLIQRPTPRRYFLAGVYVGLAAVMGRNHGLYCAAGSLGVLVWLRVRHSGGPGFRKGFVIWSAGVTLGFAPILLLALLAPGFGLAFWKNIWFFIEVKTTNLPLPIPWPWRVDFAALPADEAAREVLVGLFFLATAAFGPLGIIWAFRQRLRRQPVAPALVAASFLALPYAHHAFSRADVGHLAQGVFPLLIGCLVLFAGQPSRRRWPPALLLGAVSLYVMTVFHPGWQYQREPNWVPLTVSGSQLWVNPSTEFEVKFLRGLAAKYAPHGESFLAMPLWPGAYALLERKSPMWDVYSLFPHRRAAELAEIARLEKAKPAFVVHLDIALDGREDLRFSHNYPLTYSYILKHFALVPALSNSVLKVYLPKPNR